jgi:Lysine-specific metallo-endopeptidase
MDTIAANLYAHESYSTDQGVHLIFELVNHSKKAVHVLKWNTPLEGLQSDCLDVSKNGKPVEYDGRMVKRGAPGPEDFLTIEPGKSVSSKVDISGAYDVGNAAKFKAGFKSELLTYYTEPPTADFLMAAISKKPKQKKIKLVSRTAAFTMKRAGRKIITEGEQARRKEGNINSTSPATIKKKIQAEDISMSLALRTAKPCRIKGGTPEQTPIIMRAHQHGYELASVALALMRKKNPAFGIWFGAYSKAHFDKVKTDFFKIKYDFENKRFTYDLSRYKCGRSDYAYTYKRTATIWLCSAFWTAPPTGADSQAGTLVHEHSHASASTDDNGYGEILCKKLAKDNPAKAVRNADSHEFFARG